MKMRVLVQNIQIVSMAKVLT